ncbi:XrtA/PEP-CTERM system histidine kinase PrsK [Pseudoduganella chitinolytica]|uniref:histidine kinase n=1 Tax=Pseudoduganella chitinolytica TaxID=34070 RepID=A0ABY8BJT2_9BURK|nr:XrtA/PEP-CTERM system histidine kinase PrsK [Pseudoduganella chitinolytica]WEF34509.1 PEP-CTERM system histidine kinase PrsK [Pseudoduganella chitinolytica]
MGAAAMVAGVSHGLCALAFAGFGALVLANRRARNGQRALLVACLATALWAAALALRALGPALPAPWTVALEVARSAAWLVFLALLLVPAGLPARRLLAAVAVLTALQLALGELTVDVAAAAPVAAAAGAAPAYTAAPAVAVDMPVLAAITVRLLLAVLGILLVEQLYRHTPVRERWGIKFACLGLGTLFVYDFYLYCDALLFRRLQPDLWAARGVVDALCVPLLAITAARNPGWKLGLTLSRQVAVRSAALVGCAAYLLAMAAGGWYLRRVGGAWGALMQLAALVGAGLLLAGVLFSGAARARLRVFISKHFYQARFDYRDEWRRFTQALSEGGPIPGERAIQAIAALAESPAGALWIARDGGRLEPAARWNMPAQYGTEPLDSPFCTLLRERQWVVDASRPWPDGAQPGVELPAWLHGVAQLWLVVPLLLHGRLFGFVALARPRTEVKPDWELFDLLRLAGSQAASCLAHGELADRLAVARQFESFNRMSTFVVHDLKNLLSQHSLLLANAERHKHNPAFQEDMLETLAHSVRKMTGLLQRLSRSDPAGGDVARALPLADVVRRAVAAYAAARPCPLLEAADEQLVADADDQRLERVLAHLLQNALEATSPEGSIRVVLRRQDDAALIELRDTGIGMSEAFVRDRLFRPFETTKPAGMGIGVYESREYIRELGGRLEVESRPGVGTTFRVILPLHRATGVVPVAA